jgi:hypothetical protein
VDLDELMDELHKLDGTDVGLIPGGRGAIHISGTLRIDPPLSRTIPEGTTVLSLELIQSLPLEYNDYVKSFQVGSASVVLMPDEFVTAEPERGGFQVQLKHQSFRIFSIEGEGPPYEPQVIDLG